MTYTSPMAACPACGTQNPEVAKFCSECGGPLWAPQLGPADEARKTVTVLFCDVAGSTELGEHLDPESLRQILGRYFEAMRDVIERHSGTVEKFIGDAVMAVFGIPAVHDDDALRAVRAAVEMRVALGSLNKELERDFDTRLENKIGINTGEVLVGRQSAEFGRVTGDPVNTAARFETAAASGEILIGEDTYRSVRDAVEAEMVGPLSLKGKSDPVPAYRVLEVLPGTAAPPRSLRSPMVGRGRELEDLRRAFERAAEDRTCVLFTVLGVAGAGKSRLAEEFMDEVQGTALVVTGRCLPYGEGITYWPVAQAVRAVLDVHDFDAREQVLARVAGAVRGQEHAEAISGRLAQVLGVDEGHAPPEETAWAIRRFLEILASDRPVVALWEDVHWAEPAFLDSIDHVADWARDAPILVLCTARPEFLDTRPDWGGGKLNASALSLPPLDAVASATLIANLLGGTGLPADLTQRVNDAGGGNPLFVEQMVSMLIDDGLLVSEGGGWKATGDLSRIAVPPSVAAVLAARLDRLRADERQAIGCASVVGKVFYLGAIRELLPENLRGSARALILSIVRKELVREERSTLPGEDAFGFRHILIRDAAYGAIPKDRRADLHERFAAWALRIAGDRLEEQEEIVGYHLEQAYRYREALGPLDEGGRGLAQRASARLAAAGERAFVRPDMGAASNLLGRARALLEPTDPARVAILPKLAWAQYFGGQIDEARATISEALSLAEESSDPVAISYARLTQWSLQRRGAADREPARAVAQEALEEFARIGDERGLASAWNLLAEIEWDLGQAGPQIVAIEHAIEYARRADAVMEEHDALYSLSAALVRGPTPVMEGIERAEQVIRDHPDSREVEALMSHGLAHLRARLGEFDRARELTEVYRTFFHDTGQLFSYWRAAELAFDVETLAGNLKAACEVAEEGYAETEKMGEPYLYLAAFLAQGLYAIGRRSEAGEVALDATESTDTVERALGLAVLAKVRVHDGAEGEGLISQAVAAVEETDFLFDRATVQIDLAETMSMLGRSAEARDALERALAFLEQKGDVVSAARTRELLRRLDAR